MAQVPGPEDHEGLFERSHKEKRIDRILEAATRKRVREAEKAKPLRSIKPLLRADEDLGKVLAKALGANVKGRKKASVRATAKDTGGRSFHFEAYYTSKDDAAREAFMDKRRAGSTKLAAWGVANNITPHGTGPGGGGNGGRPDATRTKSSGGRGSSAAHLAYIEREGAVEQVDIEREVARELGLEGVLDAKAPSMGRGRPTKEMKAAQVEHAAARMAALEQIAAALRERQQRALDEPALQDVGPAKAKTARDRRNERDHAEGRGRDPFERDTAGRGQAAAAQAYLENPTKLRNGEFSLSSFGNIGETFEERRRFWDLLEEHETVAMARTQNRLIMELPHQATPEARAQIMRDFAQTFEEIGLPYHVAIHAPGPQNDDRNFHAHIVFSERPAKQMVDPATGEVAWDFSIKTETTTKCRHTKVHHPYRQPRNRDVKQKDFIPKIRKRYAECVNAVMKDVDASVKFDPRSYKDMGITTDPIETVSRITNDKLLSGGLVIRDAAWTKRMVEAELAKAVIARNKDVAALIETTKRLETLKSAWPSVNKINAEVGVFSKMMGIGRFTKATYLQLVNQRLSYENLRLQERVVTRAEATVVRDVLEATSKERREAMGPDRRPAYDAEEREAMAAIHDAATAEMAGIKERSLRERRRLNGFVLQNKLAWKATGDMMMPPPSARPIPKFVETPDPKTGKVPFFDGAAAGMAGPSAATPATRTRAPKAPSPNGATQAAQKAGAPQRPAARNAAKPTTAPIGPVAKRADAGRTDPDGTTAKKVARNACDPAGIAEGLAKAKAARDLAQAQEKAAKDKEAKELAAQFAEMAAAIAMNMAAASAQFGALKGAALGDAVRKFNEDLAKNPSANAKSLQAILSIMESRPRQDAKTAPGTSTAPAPAAAAAADAQRQDPEGQAPSTPARQAPNDAKKPSGAPPAEIPGGSPAPTTGIERRERPSLADTPIRIPNIFDHLETVDDAPARTRSGNAPAATTPARVATASAPPQAAPAASPAPGRVEATPEADVPAEAVAPPARRPVAMTPTILVEGNLEQTIPLPTPITPTPVQAAAADTVLQDVEYDAEEPTDGIPTEGEDAAAVVDGDAAEAAAKRRKAARRAGFVKRGKGGRGR